LSRTPVVVGWSGGKDSALTLWALQQSEDYEIRALLTTVTEEFDRISMHGVRRELLARQANELGVPLVEVLISSGCSSETYEERMEEALAREIIADVDMVAFGDLFLADVRAYREQRLARVGKRGLFPVWDRDTSELAKEFIQAGFRAIVCCVDPRVLDASFAGREFDERLLEDLPPTVDPCGENGEFHTFVHAGPIFAAPVSCRIGPTVEREGFVFADIVPGA
jgi:uncharacterized protein (TIGR00290 family)